MARTYAAVDIDDDANPIGWQLICSPSPSVQLIRKLRPRGFFANHATLHELEQECRRLSKFRDAEVDASYQPSLCSKESSSDTKNLHNEQAVQSPPSRRITDANISTVKPDQDTSRTFMRPHSPSVGLLKDSLVHDWHVFAENGETVPITEVPYADSSISSASVHTNFVLSGVVTKEQEQLCVTIQEWKLDLTADFSLALYAKATKQVWVQLGKPEELYEQTIRSVLVYMQLFSIVVADSELTSSMLFQHLTCKFNSWKVKPDISDLHESLILMKRFNLGCLFPLEERVLSRVTAEAGDFGESDADNGGKPLSFKRARTKRHADPESQITEASGENTVKTNLSKRSYPLSSGSDEESLILKRQTRARVGTVSTSDLDQRELSSPCRSESDHILLSSKLHDLKKRKANPLINKDFPVADRILKRKDESTETCIGHAREVEAANIERANTSSVSPDFDQGIKISHDPDNSRWNLDAVHSRMRIEKIMREEAQRGQHGHRWGSKHEYHTEPFPIIKKLWDSTSKVHRALKCLEEGSTVEEAQKICSVESLRAISVNEVALREYGVSQFLPAVSKQKEVAERINYYAHDGDTVVEICSQAVDYLSLLKERFMNLGKLCHYKRFMVDQSQRQDIKEWLNKEGLPTGSKLLICLSLSFALWGEQSNQILDSALELKPKLVVLIAPLFSRRLDEQSAYNLIWADAELLQSEILWPWGLMEVSSAALDKRKGVSPTIFLWSRTDWATKHRQIASRFGHLKKSVLIGLKGQTSNS